MKHFFSAIIALLVVIGIASYQTLSIVNLQTQIDKITQHKAGAVAIKFVGNLPTYLSGSGINASVSSIGVTSLTLKQTGQALAMSDFGTIGYATLEPGNTSRQEFISFTGITQNTNGTAVLTGVTRGLAPISPYTASTTVAFTHGGGTSVIISNSPPFYNNFAVQNNDASVTGLWTFNTNLPTSNLTPTTSSSLITKLYADSLVAQGVATATESSFGGVWLGTALQQASSTDGGTNKPYVVQTKYASSSPTSSCDGTATVGSRCIPVASTTGKIAQTYLPLSESLAFTGASTSITGTFNLIPAGMVVAFASTTAPGGWLLCNGASVATATYPTLFSAIGYGYGGSGANFTLPDFRGRSLTMASSSAALGQTGGENSHTLTVAEIPSHTHTVKIDGGGGQLGATSNANAGNSTFNTGATGGDGAHNVHDPYLAMYYIIKT